MKTVLLWGDSWWVEGVVATLPFDGVEAAADVLARFFQKERPKLRVIYQPDSLRAVATPCPNTNRRTLAAVLAEKVPGLDHPKAVWSHEPILRRHDAYHTIVHHDGNPEHLPSLVARLQDLGFWVESVWPFSTYLSYVPSEMTPSGATTVVAIGNGRACGFHHGADGRREVMLAKEPELQSQVTDWLRRMAERNTEGAATLVCSPGEAEVLRQSLPTSDLERLRCLGIAEALGSTVVLPSGHPGQLLSPPRWLSWNRAVFAVSLVLFAIGTGSGVTTVRGYQEWHALGQSRMARKEALERDIAHLKANAAEIAVLNRTLAGHPPMLGPLLHAIAETIPPEITLGRVYASDREFTAVGFVAPQAAADSWDHWVQRLRSRCAFVQVNVQSVAGGGRSIHATFGP